MKDCKWYHKPETEKVSIKSPGELEELAKPRDIWQVACLGLNMHKKYNCHIFISACLSRVVRVCGE